VGALSPAQRSILAEIIRLVREVVEEAEEARQPAKALRVHSTTEPWSR
jgi:hypothetical protein